MSEPFSAEELVSLRHLNKQHHIREDVTRLLTTLDARDAATRALVEAARAYIDYHGIAGHKPEGPVDSAGYCYGCDRTRPYDRWHEAPALHANLRAAIKVMTDDRRLDELEAP